MQDPSNNGKERLLKDSYRTDIAQETIDRWKRQFQSSRDPVRQKAIRNLLSIPDQRVISFVVREIVTDSAGGRDPLINRLKQIQRSAGQEASHFIPFLLDAYVQREDEARKGILAALQVYPSEQVLAVLKQKILKRIRGGPFQERKRLKVRYKIARLLRFTKELPHESARSIAEICFSLAEELPEALHSEIVSVLQHTFQIHSLPTLEKWRGWWEEHGGKSRALLFREANIRTTKHYEETMDGVLSRIVQENEEETRTELLRGLQNREHSLILEKVFAAIQEQEWTKESREKIGQQLLRYVRPRWIPTIRLAALRTIASVGKEDLALEIVHLLDDFRPAIRAATARTLRTLGNSGVEEEVRKRLKREYHPRVLEELVTLISSLNFRSAVPELERKLVQEESIPNSVRISIIEALGKLGKASTVEVFSRLLEQLERKDSSYVRNVQFWIAHSLGEIGASEGVELLLNLLNTSENSLRREVVKSLGKISFQDDQSPDRRKRVLDRFQEILNDRKQNLAIRSQVAKSTGKVGGEQAVAFLVEAISREDSDVQQDIRSSLEKLSGKFPEKLESVTRKLHQEKLYNLIISICSRFPSLRNGAYEKIMAKDEVPPVFSALDREALGHVKRRLAEAYIEEENWEAAQKVLQDMETFLEEREQADISLMKVKVFRHVRAFSKVFSTAEAFKDKLSRGSDIWWELQVELLLAKFQQGKPEQVLRKRNELKGLKNIPDKIQKRLKELFLKSENMKESANRFIQQIEAEKQLNEELSSKARAYLEDRPERLYIVQRLLDHVEKLDDVSDGQRSLYMQIFGRLTGRTIEEVSSSDQWTSAREEWRTWLEEQRE